jgi:hypothetical protein
VCGSDLAGRRRWLGGWLGKLHAVRLEGLRADGATAYSYSCNGAAEVSPAAGEAIYAAPCMFSMENPRGNTHGGNAHRWLYRRVCAEVSFISPPPPGAASFPMTVAAVVDLGSRCAREVGPGWCGPPPPPPPPPSCVSH